VAESVVQPKLSRDRKGAAGRSLAVIPPERLSTLRRLLHRAGDPVPKPRYLLRDGDRIFGDDFVGQVKVMGITEALSAARSPWQPAYVERVIGTIRRECLDHLIVFSEALLCRHVKSFVAYDHESRTHLWQAKDSPESRPVQPPELGQTVAIPQVGGLHHRYERRAA